MPQPHAYFPTPGSQLGDDSKVGFDNELRRLLAVYLFELDSKEDPERPTFQRVHDAMQADRPTIKDPPKAPAMEHVKV